MGAPAGWYDDPQDPQQIRYFDGRDWTGQTAPRSASPTQTGAAAPAPGQSTGQWQGQAQQFTTPAAPVSPTAGFAFGGAQQVPTADAPQSEKPKGIGLVIVGVLVAIGLVMGLGFALSKDPDEGKPGLDAAALGLADDFSCQDLADAFVELSVGDSDELTEAHDLSERLNTIGSVTLPEPGHQNVVMRCGGTGTWAADGVETKVVVELWLESDGGLSVSAS